MKRRIMIGFRRMAGMGPAAWDRDESATNMHTRPVHSHAVHETEEKVSSALRASGRPKS